MQELRGRPVKFKSKMSDRLTIRLPDELLKFLEDHCVRNGSSKSELVQRIISQYSKDLYSEENEPTENSTPTESDTDLRAPAPLPQTAPALQSTRLIEKNDTLQESSLYLALAQKMVNESKKLIANSRLQMQSGKKL
ncbi:MAG: CopG family transcriptional regulator [SAR324 cluster bacterium]|nr:CopG family transcriptional regulator [SAR324 cluster bacterium]